MVLVAKRIALIDARIVTRAADAPDTTVSFLPATLLPWAFWILFAVSRSGLGTPALFASIVVAFFAGRPAYAVISTTRSRLIVAPVPSPNLSTLSVDTGKPGTTLVVTLAPVAIPALAVAVSACVDPVGL